MNKTFEIEFRAKFGYREYKRLKTYLDRNAEILGPDNKIVNFFVLPDRLLKVVENTSTNKAEVVLKLNRIGHGSEFEEITLPIERKYISTAKHLFTQLGITNKIMTTPQKRINYRYKGVVLALKYSNVWGYHLELEIVVTDLKYKAVAEKNIRAVADELKIKLLTEKQLKNFVEKVETEQFDRRGGG